MDIETKEFTIKGMTCASCVNRVEKVISKVEGKKVYVGNLKLMKEKISTMRK